MSLTKRYLESLPADEQDAILGGIDNVYISPDEWTNDAENEPTDDELAEWARALIEEDAEETETRVTTADYLRAQIAKAEADIAHGVGSRESKTKRLAALKAVLAREEAPLVKPEGKCVTLESNGVEWKV